MKRLALVTATSSLLLGVLVCSCGDSDESTDPIVNDTPDAADAKETTTKDAPSQEAESGAQDTGPGTDGDASQQTDAQDSATDTATDNTEAGPTYGFPLSAGGEKEDRGCALAIDTSGNLYVGGYFDEKQGKFGDITLKSYGGYDTFVMKVAPTGQVLWAVSPEDLISDGALGIVVDKDGNSYVSGFYSAQVRWGTTNLQSSSNTSRYIAKLSPSGDPLWAIDAGAADPDSGSGLALDSSGNLWITGAFEETITFGSTKLTSAGEWDLYVAKLSTSDGSFQGAWSFGGAGKDDGRALAFDAQGNVLLAGVFEQTVSFGSQSLTSKGLADIVVAKLTPTGTVTWAVSGGGPYMDDSYGLVVDPSGNAFVAGDFFESFELGTNSITGKGNADLFVTKVTSAGAVEWVTSTGGLHRETARALVRNTDGDLLLTGWIDINVDGVPFGTTVLKSNGFKDNFVAKMSASGEFKSALSFGGLATDEARDIVLDSKGAAFVTGSFEGAVNFGSATLDSGANMGDIFVAKFELP